MGKKYTTSSGIELKACYSATQAEKPGSYPFTRGIYQDMYRGKLFTMRQYSGYGSAHKTNERFRYLLAKGVSGLSVAFDLPTQMGMDSDNSLALGEVGKVGVAISSVPCMESLLKDIPLEDVSISMTINSTAIILLGMLLIIAKQRGVAWKDLRGTIQNDILKEYIARGTYIYPPKASLRITKDIFSFCQEQVPSFNTISISGYHIREAGSSAIEELGLTFSNAICYIEHALAAGLKLEDFAPRMSFFFNSHSDFFEEIAKFRAARRIWAKLIKERYRCSDKRSQLLRFHAQTAGSTLTAQQPYNNVVRTAYEALAAVLGGAQSLHTNAYDEALALPTEQSAELALRTQQILAYESGVTSVADPLGGSYLIEELTDQIEAQVWELIDKVDKLGGVIKAIEDGVVQSIIEKSAYQYQKLIESSERIVVGVNFAASDIKLSTETLKIDTQDQIEQIGKITSYKSQPRKHLSKSLSELKQAAQGSDNLVPKVIDALNSKATLGEISATFESVFGKYQG